MKRVIMFSAVIFMFISNGQAQDDWVFEGFLSPHFTKEKPSSDFQDEFTAKFPTNYNFKSKIGFGGGLGVGRKFDNVFTMLEFGYEKNIIQYETEENYTYATVIANRDTVLNGLVTFEEKIDRIPINILATVRVLGDDGGLTLTFGPSFLLGLQGTRSEVFDTGNKTYPLSPTEEFELGSSRFHRYRGLDFGFIFGLGAMIPINDNFKFTAEFRTRLGMTDLYTEARKNYLSDFEDIDIIGKKMLRNTYLKVGVKYLMEWF
jgi:hypothetical protein